MYIVCADTALYTVHWVTTPLLHDLRAWKPEGRSVDWQHHKVGHTSAAVKREREREREGETDRQRMLRRKTQ